MCRTNDFLKALTVKQLDKNNVFRPNKRTIIIADGFKLTEFLR